MSKSVSKPKPKPQQQHLYIDEWLTHLDLSVEEVARRMKTSRTNIYRWIEFQNRLTPQKIADLAAALGIKPQQFWKLPPEKDEPPSIDALVEGKDKSLRSTAYDLVERLLRK